MNITDFARDHTDASGRTFIYRARTGINYAPTDPLAESVRTQWLEKWMADNNVCRNGYKIKSRDAMSLGGHPDAMRLTYVVDCP